MSIFLKIKNRFIFFAQFLYTLLIAILFGIIFHPIINIFKFILTKLLNVLTFIARGLLFFARYQFKGYIVLIFFLLLSIPMGIWGYKAHRTNVDLRNENRSITKERDLLIADNDWLRLATANEAHKYEQCNEDLYFTRQELESYKEQAEGNKVKPTVNNTKAQKFVANYRNGTSPIKNYVDQFYKVDPIKGEIALALSGMESGFGNSSYAKKYYNAWGFFCNHGGIRPNCSWQSKPMSEYTDFIKKYDLENASEDEIRWRYAITRYMEASDKYLKLYDGSKASITKISNAGYYKVGMDGATQASVNNWVNNVYWFTEQL